MKELLPYLSLAVSVVACAISAWVAVRAGRWRETDDAKALMRDVIALGNRMTTAETQLKQVATKADVAQLRAELEGLERLIRNTDAGVTRIESHLMGMAR